MNKGYTEFMESGILELYVMDLTDVEENKVVEDMVKKYPSVQLEIEQISMALEHTALERAVQPDPIIKPFLLAILDYSDRMKNGEEFTVAPVLSENSKPSDYAQWLDRPDMVLPDDFEDIHAKIISYTPELLSAIVWIGTMAPQEVHDNQYEKFLILEGTCDIHVEEEVYPLKAGDYMTIPLHKSHHVLVTSAIPCKVILQRVAA